MLLYQVAGCSSTRGDVVLDLYCKFSINNAECASWKSRNLEFKNIVGSQLIKQSKSFISLAKKC